MKLIHKIKHFFVALYHLFIAAGKGFAEDRVMKLSAALAYYTIFSIAPLLFLLIALVGLIPIAKTDTLYQEIGTYIGTDAANQIHSTVASLKLNGKSGFGFAVGVITLLIGASADGLEVLTRSNEWLPIKAQHTDIVVNVGDMLQRLTNNKLRSTTHRVVNPPRELMKTSRYSVPFFLHPKASMDLTSLASCIDEEHPKVYEDMTAGEYLDQRLREIGLKN